MKILKALLEKLKGKKTYAALILFLAALVAQLCGINISDSVLVMLGGMAGIGGRNAIRDAVKEVKDVANEVKDVASEVKDVRDAVKKLNIPKL